MIIETIQSRRLYPLYAMLLWVVFSAPALAQFSKAIEIELPSSASKNPSVNRPALKVSPGDEVEFKLKARGNVFMIFSNPGKTPFVNDRGEPVYWLRLVDRSNRYTIRTDTNPCAETEPGKSDCKYMIVDLKNSGRPPLDPYIIILR